MKINVQELFGFDLRSLALFRITFALVIIADLIIRAGDIKIYYSDSGVVSRQFLIDQLNHPWHWSINLISGQPIIQLLLFILAGLITLAFLVGYRTKLATIAVWVMIISIHNRNPALIFAADDVLRVIAFWAMFLPLGACYSIDSALNSSRKTLPKSIVSGATFAFMVQMCFIYMWSAAYKSQSEVWWPDGDAVYYALSFDQYGTALGQLLLNFPWLLKPLTFIALWFEWLGPLLIFIPFRNSLFRGVAVISFIFLHIGFGLCFELGIFPFLSISTWLVFIPSQVWDWLENRIKTQKRQGLKIYYDADCGFCKKVVHLLRTFLILPKTPLLIAQEEREIYTDMQQYNSWVVVDWQDNRYFKWEAMAYVVSLSPILNPLAKILKLSPFMTLGTRFYETIATHRKVAGIVTKPLKFRPVQVSSLKLINIITLLFLLYTAVWNLRIFSNGRMPDSLIAKTLRRKTFNSLDWISRVTKFDRSWSIFAPSPPRDDGWHVIQGQLKDGSRVDVLKGGNITWEKPSRKQRNSLYKNMQWRTYFINLNRSIGKKLYPEYGNFLCREWNSKHSGKRQLENLDIYFMKERTVPPGETQNIEKTEHWQQSCSDEK